MKINIILSESHMQKSRRILNESCDGLDSAQRRVVEGIYKELQPLIEASLDPNKIQQLFGAIEKAADDAGSNRTMLGKGVDVAKAADETINKIGRWLQNTKPVAMFDQKFEDLKTKISAKFPKLAGQVEQMGEWAKANPGKTAAIIGVMTTIAALAGGPLGGAIAGQILRGSTELLKGEKLSTAIGKGVKTAAYGFIAGKTFELIGDALSSGAQVVKDNLFPGAVKLNMTQIFDEVGGELGSRYATFEIKGLIGKPEDIAAAKTMFNDAAAAWKAGDYNQSNIAWRTLNDYIEDTLKSPEYVAALAADEAKRQMITQAAEAAQEMTKFLGAAAQGAVAAAGAKGSLEKKESYYVQQRPLSEGQVYMIFNRLCRVNEQMLSEGLLVEGPMDFVKGVAAKGMKKLATTGKNLTTRFTVDKLNKIWTNAGSPTEPNDLYNVLNGGGVPDDLLASVFKSLKIPVVSAGSDGRIEPTLDAPVDYKQVKQMVMQLPKDRKQRLINYINKQLAAA